MATVGAACLAWSLVEARWHVLRTARVAVLAPDAVPIRLLHISDLHLTPSSANRIAWVRDLGSLRPDLVVNTGDNLGHADAMPNVLHALEPLLSTPGAFVMGSNDSHAPRMKSPFRYFRTDSRMAHQHVPGTLPISELGKAFSEAGWLDLTNRRDGLTVRGAAVELVGVDDPHLDRDEYPGPALSAASPGAGADGDGSTPLEPGAARAQSAPLRLGVTHAPYRRVLDQMHADGCDVVLAGHTHGGQVCVPGWGALVTNCDLDPRRAKGLHGWPGGRPDEPGGEASSWLHVSAGLGTSPYTPIRFACRPEATLLELVPRSAR